MHRFWVCCLLLFLGLEAAASPPQWRPTEGSGIKLARPVPLTEPRPLASTMVQKAAILSVEGSVIERVVFRPVSTTVAYPAQTVEPPLLPERKSSQIITMFAQPAAETINSRNTDFSTHGEPFRHLPDAEDDIAEPSVTSPGQPGSAVSSTPAKPPGVPALEIPTVSADFPEEGPPFRDLSPEGGSIFYLSGEYLLWWIRGSVIPALVTTAPVLADQNNEAVLGQPGTRLAFGNSRLLEGENLPGGRFLLGWWLDNCEGSAIEAGYLFLGQHTTHFSISSFDSLVIGRPFFNLNRQVEDRLLVSSPGLGQATRLVDARGSVTIDAPTQLWGLDLVFRHGMFQGEAARLDLLLGIRYLDLEEGLQITSDITSLKNIAGQPAFDAGNLIRIQDRFDTHNQFYGGQLGTRGEWCCGIWKVEGTVKVGLGLTQQVVEVAGQQNIVRPDGTRSNFQGGLLALPDNSGRMQRQRFAVLTEAGFKLRCQLTEHLSGWVGYDLILWNSVVRPGEQIDRHLDVNRIPNFLPAAALPHGQAGPRRLFRESDFWAQGVNFGLEMKY